MCVFFYDTLNKHYGKIISLFCPFSAATNRCLPLAIQCFVWLSSCGLTKLSCFEFKNYLDMRCSMFPSMYLFNLLILFDYSSVR